MSYGDDPSWSGMDRLADFGRTAAVDRRGTMERTDKATPRRANGRGHGTEGVTSMQEKRTDTERFRKYARERLSDALCALAGDGADLEVLGEIQLALMAANMYYGDLGSITLTPSDVVEYVDEPDPECTCPPGLVARGGFRSGCPVHG